MNRKCIGFVDESNSESRIRTLNQNGDRECARISLLNRLQISQTNCRSKIDRNAATLRRVDQIELQSNETQLINLAVGIKQTLNILADFSTDFLTDPKRFQQTTSLRIGLISNCLPDDLWPYKLLLANTAQHIPTGAYLHWKACYTNVTVWRLSKLKLPKFLMHPIDKRRSTAWTTLQLAPSAQIY